MAATLNADQEEIVHFSFPIEKREDTATINPVDGTPDILITGKATDGTIDGDREIVDPEWSAKAIQEWCDTGGNVRMSHDPKRPVGKGRHVQVTTDGHYVTSLIADPLCKHFIRTGILNDYSVGISMPDFRHRDSRLDPQGKALRIITGRADGLSRIAELSVVDRGSNFNSRFQIVRKSAGNGDGDEFVGQMVGDEDEITKAAPSGLLTKAAQADDDLVNVDLPPGASISISPADFARLHTFKQQLVTKGAGADTEKRDVSTAERRSLASEGNALPDGSYPINSTGDLHNAAHLARTGHGDVAAARRLIARRAKELGVANPLDESDDAKADKSVTAAAVEQVQSSISSVDDVRASLDLPPWAKEISEPVVFTKQGPIPMSEAKHLITKAQEADTAKAADAPAEQAEATPDVTKDPAPEPARKAKKKPKGPKKMPPWLKGDDDDAKGSSDGGPDDDDASKACKSVSDHLWTGVEGTSDIVCSKCHTTPAAAAGVTAAPMQAAPVTELQESDGPACTKDATPASASGAVAEAMKPAPAHREPDGAAAESFEADAGMADGDKAVKYAPDLAPDPEVAALLRFKAAGTDEDLGRLHDLTCPAFSPEMAAAYHPYADMGALIDSGAWQRKTLHAAAGPLKGAMEMQEIWQAALLLKTADMADLNDWRAELHKAFRDANPGPGSYPTPGCVMPGSYNRPVLTDGRAANGVDYAGPNSAPQVATSAPDAQGFDRPPLSAGHQSPSHMKGDGTYPSERGVPTQLTYAQMQREGARQALVRMHHHLARQFPEACPIGLEGPAQPERHAVPVPAGIGKGATADDSAGPTDSEVTAAIQRAQSQMIGNRGRNPRACITLKTSDAAALKATPEGEADLFADAEVFKSFKKMRKKLGKKILSGKITVDEARAHLGRQFAQKAAEPEVAKADSAVSSSVPGTEVVYNVSGGFDPELIKAAVREALHVETVPLEAAEIRSFDPSPAIEAAVTKALAPFAEQVTTKLAEQQRVIDAIADQPDPSTAAFSGLAFQPQVIKSRRPAAVPDQAEYAARAQQMVRRNLQNTYQTHSDPYVREAAAQSLATMGVGTGTEAS